jgi:methanogenic corrinoid protein MtbC1
VHYQTVYRWVRSGRLPASKVAGAYLVEGKALEAFASARRRPEPPPKPSAGRLDRSRDRMTGALVDGDETAAFGIARELVRSGTSVTELIDAVIVPPLRVIGERWHAGEFGIYVEHRASAIVERLIGELTPNPRGRRRGTAVVAALSGDRHALPTAMATAALREDRWTVEHLGADIPVADVIGFIDDHEIDLVVVSATGTSAEQQASGAAEEIEAVTAVPTLVGGGGSSLADLQLLARRTSGG